LLPLGAKQAPARRVLHGWGQHPPLAPLGAGSLYAAATRAAATTTPGAVWHHGRDLVLVDIVYGSAGKTGVAV